MAEFTTENGADIVIRIAPFEDAMRLKSAITKELANSGFDLEGLKITADTELTEMLPAIIKAVLSLDSSESVNSAIFQCLRRCTYDGEKISRDTFEDIKARENYYQIVFECLRENLLPFFKGLNSVFTSKELLIKALK